MKRRMIFLGVFFFFVAGGAFLPQAGKGEVEWRVVKDVDLNATPLDFTSSADGKLLFILTPGEILIHSFQEGKITDRIPIDKNFDKIASLPWPNLVTVSSSVNKSLRVIFFESIFKIDITDLPFKGPQDAFVTVAVFDDYQ